MHKVFLILVLLSSLLFGWQLLRPGFFSTHDDLQAMRVYEMDRCLKDGQIPCRWAPDMSYGYGQPLFNYYSAFPYYLTGLVRQLGVSNIDTVKIAFLLSIIAGGIGAFLLAAEFLTLPASFIVSLVYIASPYRALDIFVRGALSEIWAVSLIPLVILYIVRTIKNKRSASPLLLSLSLGAFLTSHNLITLVSVPFIAIFALVYWLSESKRISVLKRLLLSATIGAGLSAFFTLPVLFERNLIQQSQLFSGYFDYNAHFLTLRQLFLPSSWGYGPSVFGPGDDLSFFIGILPLLALVLSPLTIFIFLRQKNHKMAILSLIFVIFSLISLFLTHTQSAIIWRYLPLLHYLQFPWRMLGLTLVFTSLLLGLVFMALPHKSKPYVFVLMSLAVVLLNLSIFRFNKFSFNSTDQDILSSSQISQLSRGGLTDYLPQSVRKEPESTAPDKPRIIGDKTDLKLFEKRSNYFAAEFDVYSDEVTVIFPITYFPGWTLYHNRQPQPMRFTYDNDLGLITIKLNKGTHLIQAWFEDTPVRTVANIITFLSGAGLIIWFVLGNEKRLEK